MFQPHPPEGRLLTAPENQAACATLPALLEARVTQRILEGRTLLCTPEHDLLVSVGPFVGRIPRAEAALGIAEGATREIAILSRVGKPVCFTVTQLEEAGGGVALTLSRRQAQERTRAALMATLCPGQVISATVTHLEPFGAFVDMGAGLPSMIGIEQLSISRINHPNRRLTVGQEVWALVTGIDRATGRILLSHRELLGTWLENAARFQVGATTEGYVRGVKPYGVFIELAPNLSGLAEPREDLQEGDRVSVYLKAILPDKMKIKLLVIEKLPPLPLPPPLPYFVTGGVLTRWDYAPPGCARQGHSVFFPPPQGEDLPLTSSQ